MRCPSFAWVGGKMEVQRSYLTRDHERLLNYAVWAKYIAWVVLGVYALGAVLGFVGRMSVASVQLGTLRSEANSFARLLAAEPGFALNLLFGSISSLFQGLVY